MSHWFAAEYFYNTRDGALNLFGFQKDPVLREEWAEKEGVSNMMHNLNRSFSLI